MLTYCNGPKEGIKLLKISYVRIFFLVSLLFVAARVHNRLGRVSNFAIAYEK